MPRLSSSNRPRSLAVPRVLTGLTAALLACGDAALPPPGDPQGSDGICDAPQRACSLSHVFPTRVLPSGSEVSDLCLSWTLNNATDLWVHSVEIQNDGLYHHSNWLFVPETVFTQPDGAWGCSQGGFDEVSAAALGGVLFAQTTQARAETQKFPQGAAVRVPAYSRVIGSVHLLNSSPGEASTTFRMSVRSIPDAEVTRPLAPFRLSYYDLRLPAQRSSEFSSDCGLRQAYEKFKQQPFSFRLYYALPHYHHLGTAFRLSVFGGPQNGRRIFESEKSLGDPGGQIFDPPLELSDSDGLSFTCRFHNPSDAVVKWGIGDQEMCVMLGFSDSPIVFDAAVAPHKSTLVSERDNTSFYQGPCTIPVFNYNP